jgi:hypothetical protein
MPTTAREASAGLKPIKIQHLLRKVRFPAGPDHNCHVVDEHGLVYIGSKPVFVGSATVSAILHGIASHIDIKTHTSDVGYKTLLDECGLSRNSRGSFSDSIKFLRYAYGILLWNYTQGKTNSYWIDVVALRRLIADQGFMKLEGKRSQLFFGDELDAKEALLSSDPYYGAKFHLEGCSPWETTQDDGGSSPEPVGPLPRDGRVVAQTEEGSSPEPRESLPMGNSSS